MKITVTMNINERSYIDRTATKIAALFGKTYDPSKYWRTEKTTTHIYTSDGTIASDGGYTGIMNIKSEFIYDVLDITAESISKFYTIGNQVITLAKAIGVDFKGFGQSIKTRMKKWIDEEKAAEKYNARFYMRARKIAEKSTMRTMHKNDMQDGTLYTLTGIQEDGEWHTWTGTGDDFIEFATGEAKKLGVEKFHSFKAEIKHGSMVSFTEIELKKDEPAEAPNDEELLNYTGDKPFYATDREIMMDRIRGAIGDDMADDGWRYYTMNNGDTVADTAIKLIGDKKTIAYVAIIDLRDRIVTAVSDSAGGLSGQLRASGKAPLDNENLVMYRAYRIDPMKGTVENISEKIRRYYNGNFFASSDEE